VQRSDLSEAHKHQKHPRLTNRERDILYLLSSGLTNREIGEILYLSRLTVRNYISRLLLKFEVRNRTALVTKVIAFRQHQHKRLLP